MTPDLLRAATGCTTERAALFAPHLSAACMHYRITGHVRMAAFLAQIGHESDSLRYTSELWGPTPAQERYEGRADLGNIRPGDGSRYRGRGLIQVTGRDNYRQAARRMQPLDAPDFEDFPEAVEEPRWAAWTAADWWAANGCNDLADRGDFVAVTRRINGGTNGLQDRQARWELAKAALAAYGSNLDTSPEPVQKTPESTHIPPGDAPDWTPPVTSTQTEHPMAPILAGLGKSILINALPELVQAIPRLGAIFGAGASEVAQRNVKALEEVAKVASSAMGAVNAQDLVEGLQDKGRADAARAAIDRNWAGILDMVEAGGGGIEGAGKRDAATSARGDMLHSPSFWVTILLLPLVYLVVGSVVGLWGGEWPSDVRAAIATAVVSLIVGGAAGYYWGQTTSRNRTPS